MSTTHEHDRGHGHEHAVNLANRSRLLAAIAIVSVVLIVEVVGAVLSGSLALVADAGHMLSDLTGLVVALVATVMAARPATDRHTFGSRRAEVFAAFINGAILLTVVIVVTVEAVRRLVEPAPGVQATLMLVVAVIGAVANTAALLVLRGGAKDSINMRGAYLEVLGDLVGSMAVAIAAVIILLTGFERADAIASLAIAVLILPRAASLLRDVIRVLSQGAPRGTDVALIREHVLGTAGVVSVHDVHVWSIAPGSNVFSAHVVVEPRVFSEGRADDLLDALSSCLAEHFDVEHSTFQLEPAEHAKHEVEQHR
ncbi:MAG: cobalt-zinc-cadmium efflux system protein [Microbacteriaceae bacterium]|jgi:cobalt-zinc-cadmium efflux system protein|nr:cation transporter [Microbacteriaceae bacterium]MDQ1525928.1 cobalt-zinc-cadmium efflux system protein [Microbacteriaceae bacterium]MDQ1553459.1 cobalt-zinc-cadmium efflux system protein [Microbacteriaceae bacterium]